MDEWEARDRAAKALRQWEQKREWRRYQRDRAACWRRYGKERAEYHEREAARTRLLNV